MTDWGLCKYFCTMLGNFKGYNCKRFPMVNKNREDELGVRIVFGLLAVSYTHLTLPTNREV